MAVKKTETVESVVAEPTTVTVEVPRRSPWGIAAALAASALVGALAFGGGVLLGANLPGQGGPQGVTFTIPDGGQFDPQQRP